MARNLTSEYPCLLPLRSRRCRATACIRRRTSWSSTYSTSYLGFASCTNDITRPSTLPILSLTRRPPNLEVNLLDRKNTASDALHDPSRMAMYEDL